ncbi:MAG: SecY-interacting protein [Thiotrichales bacterium]|nr:SecY-interacting protein [Thiotrichales bacterium]|tara:strand:+ start:197 stop:757 length:561 start_codon:yes stop_codon:yes gene_type:complete
MFRNKTRDALAAFLDRFVEAHEHDHGGLPQREHDPEWISPCEVGAPDDQGMVAWQPMDRPRRGDFRDVEKALGMSFHADIKAFYGSFWSGHLEARAEEGGLTLIQVWNEGDFERLCENVIGHVIAKRRTGGPMTVFIAVTDEDELMLCIDNDSGQVVLENPGQRPVQTVETSLSMFLDRLTPVVMS